MSSSLMTLASKPGAQLSYIFIPPSGAKLHQPLVVFLNGLGLPASSWLPIMSSIAARSSHVAMLSYDRYGQGLTTDRDPRDARAEDPNHGHDCLAAVQDLRELITQICKEKNLKNPQATGSHPAMVDPPIFFVANSLGCAIARLYADMYPGTVSTLLFLDSIIANSDFISLWPDPDAPDFVETAMSLPDGVSEEGIRETRKKYGHIFHPVTGIMGSAEGLSRKNLAELLPYSDRPRLQFGGEGKGPWLTVVGHGFDAFAEEGLKNMGTPLAITQNYSNPYWHGYNEGLARITSSERSTGPIQAEKCGHFIQRDDPDFVVGQMLELLRKQGL